MKSQKKRYKKKKVPKKLMELPLEIESAAVILALGGLKMFVQLAAVFKNGIPVEAQPEEKQIDNIETVDAEIISSKIKN